MAVSCDEPGLARTAPQGAERHVRPRLDIASAEPQSEAVSCQTSQPVAPDGVSSATAREHALTRYCGILPTNASTDHRCTCSYPFCRSCSGPSCG
eukprot:4364597-Pyramimonas_sp.AAC.1